MYLRFHRPALLTEKKSELYFCVAENVCTCRQFCFFGCSVAKVHRATNKRNDNDPVGLCLHATHVR